MRLKRIIGAWLALVLWVSTGLGALTTGDICFVCQKEIRFTVYTWTDKVTRTKIRLCFNCTELPDNCYLCSVPVLKNHKTLPDGRVICQRDLDSVVLDDRQAVQICDAVKEKLERQLIRFLSFPETKTTVQLMDRVHLQELFKVIGNDFSCPNTLGCTETKTNQGRHEFVISILSGQPKEDVMTTCVHEYAHTWIIENVSAARHKTIGKDAIEGFCELLAYLFAEQQGLPNGKSNILANHYTRGQIHLFIAAHAQYGLPDIIDWMIQGDDPLLLREDLSRVRRLADAPKPSNIVPIGKPPITKTETNTLVKPPGVVLPEHLRLQAIIWSPNQPCATINGQVFAVNETKSVSLRHGPITVKCIAIHPHSVVLETNRSSERLMLEMK